MQRLHLLESKTFVAGGNVQVSLRDLPMRHRVKGIVLRLEAVITQGAGSVAITGDKLATIFNNIEIGKRIKGSGRYFDLLNWAMHGHQLSQDAATPAGAGVFRRNIELFVPFNDFVALSPEDTAPLSDFFRDTPIIADFINPTSAWDANTSVAGTLRAAAVVEAVEPGIIPSPLQLGYVDWSGQQPQIEGGYLYTHLFLFKDVPTLATSQGITNAEISSASVSVDGERLVDLAKSEELAFLFDVTKAAGTSVRTDSATAPVFGEQLESAPGYAAAAPTTVTHSFLPLLHTTPGYKLTNAYPVERGLRIDFTGSLTTFRIGYRRIEARSAEAALRAALKAGITSPLAARVRAKTASKKDLAASKAPFMRFLPLRHD